MTKYNNFARRLDTAYKTSLNEFATAYQQMGDTKQKAARALDTAKLHNDNVGIMRAKADAVEADENFREAGKRIWADFNAQRAAIKKELEAAVKSDNMASPDAVDPNGLEILRSGIMAPEEYEAFAERYDTNPTMLRFLAKYAEAAAKEMHDDPRGRGILNSVAQVCQEGRSSVLRAWDNLSRAADYCSGQSREGRIDRPEHILSMGKHWESLSAETIENF